MTIRCKFRCSDKYQNSDFGGVTIKMWQVYSDDPDSENKKFWEATPSGYLEFQCVKSSAVESLTVDKEYYIDIMPCGEG